MTQEQVQEQDQDCSPTESYCARLETEHEELTLKNKELERQLKKLMTRIGVGRSSSVRRKLRSHSGIDIRKTMNHFAEQIRGIPQDSMTACKRVVLDRSGVEGWGVFVNDDFTKGDKILRYEGETISRDESDKREEIYNLTSTSTFFMAKADKKTVIDATNTKHISRFVNHSCTPNAGKRCRS
jgi:SET domain-containing protein